MTIVVASLCPAGTVVQQKETENFVLKLLEENGRTVDLSVINAENQAAVFALLRGIAIQKRKMFGTTVADDVAAKMILLRLADPETMQRTVDAFMRKNDMFAYNDLTWSEQAAIIPYIADGFYLEDEVNAKLHIVGGIRVVPQAWRATYVAGEILINSQQFSQDVRTWAKTDRTKSIQVRRAALRTWWKQNEGFFKAFNYKAVRPPIAEQLPATETLNARINN